MRRLVAAMIAAALCGCTVGPDFLRPETQTAPTYAAPGDAPAPADQAVALGKDLPADWWRAFQAPALDALVTQAFADNQTVAAAQARLDAAKEAVNAARGALQPEVTLGADVGRQKYGQALFGPAPFTIPAFTYYTIGPSAKFPLDLFGGGRRNVEAKAAWTEAKASELDAAYLSLAGGVATQAMAAAAAREQLGVLEAVIADDQRNVDLVRKAVDIGSGTRTQLLTAQSQLAADRTLLPALRQQEAVARHALAILVGKAPADWTPPDFALAEFTLPAEIPASLPSALARRRPDIRAAEARLHVASAEIGVATANLYPDIDLVGTLTQQALTPGALFESGATAWSIAANITQPLFDGGRRSAEKRAAVARYHEALANYRQAILTSFQDVADRLQALANDADQLQAQDEATRTAASALDLARRSYQAGNSGIIDVLDAQRLYAQAESGLARARAQRLIDTVALYLALGGANYGKGVEGS